MNKKVRFLIYFGIIVLLISLVLYFNFFSKFRGLITGNPVFSDDDFIVNASEFGAGADFEPQGGIVSLSPEDCKIKSVSPNSISVNFGENFSIDIRGQSCYGSEVELKIFEEDLFYDDEVAPVFAKFIGNRAHLELLIDENYSYLFDEFFEGKELELYFRANLTNLD